MSVPNFVYLKKSIQSIRDTSNIPAGWIIPLQKFKKRCSFLEFRVLQSVIAGRRRWFRMVLVEALHNFSFSYIMQKYNN